MRRLLAALAAAAFVWTLLVWLAGGVDLRMAGLAITSHDPIRPAIAGLVLASLYVWLARRGGWRDDVAFVRRTATPARLALATTIASAAVAFAFRATTAGGSDAYGYVTHADAWLAGPFTTPVALARDAPWPRAIDTFTPFAQHPSPDGRGLLPVTSPGLPMLMAAFKMALGHCAMFWVVPLTTALFVWSTFVAGRRAVSDGAGLGATWLVATSPTVVSMSKSVMSDVPAAAFWALSIAGALRPTLQSSVLAGLAATMAILIRPNVVPLALWIGVWIMWRDWRSGTGLSRTLGFSVAVVPGCALVALMNAVLRGSPLASGYGDLGSLFTLANVPTNLTRYISWMVETQTPLWIAGLCALAIPWRRLWPSPGSSRSAALLLGSVVTVVGLYVSYGAFDAWWFLRFLLPAWPAIAIGTATLLLSPPHPALKGLGTTVLFAVGIYGIVMTLRLGVFPPGEGERRYATIAEVVARHTEPTSVIITLQDAGPVRYYAGRDAIRFDLLDERWLDRAVQWLERQGRKPYFLLEEWDVAEFRRRFGPHNTLAREMSPVVAYRAHKIHGWAYLYDPRRPDAVTQVVPSIVDPRPHCPLPAAGSR